jgi:ABC-2 type transport system ATP-binding protein
VRAEELLEHFASLEGVAERRARREVVEALLRQVNLLPKTGRLLIRVRALTF